MFIKYDQDLLLFFFWGVFLKDWHSPVDVPKLTYDASIIVFFEAFQHEAFPSALCARL